MGRTQEIIRHAERLGQGGLLSSSIPRPDQDPFPTQFQGWQEVPDPVPYKERTREIQS